MKRVVAVLVLGLVLAAVANARAAESGRRGGGMMRGSFLALLGMEQVQQELKLTDEQKTKVKEVAQKLQEETKEQFSGLRDMQDREQRRVKMTELADQMDAKAREQLQGVLDRDQMRRLYQIRLQVRGAVESLASGRLAERLQLTDEQKKKIAELQKATQENTSAVFSGMRDLSDEQRNARMAELRDIRAKADEQVLALLTAEQQEGFEKAKGEKFELRQ